MQRSPKYGQSAETEASRSQQQQQQQQQEQQSKANVKRQSLTQQQQQGASGPQDVQDHPSQPAGLFPEKHARAASADKAIGGGNAGAGRPGTQTGGLGKVFYFIDQMKMEVVEADRAIKSLQTDIRLLREKNKELERKHTEEKLAREAAEAKVKSLKKKVRELKEQVPEGAAAPEGTAKPKKMNDDNAYADEKKSSEVIAAPGDSYAASAEQPPRSQAAQRATKRLPRTSSLSPKREAEERYASKGSQPPPKIAESAKPNPNSKSMVLPHGKGGKGQGPLPANDAAKDRKAAKSQESNNTSSTTSKGTPASDPKATTTKHSLASSPRNQTDQQSMAKRNIDAALNALGGGARPQGRMMSVNELSGDASKPTDSGQLQHVQQQQQQQQQQQHEMPSAAMLRDWLESQAAGQQNANLALAQQLAAAQNGGGFAASAPSPQPQINSLALAGLLGQNVSGLNNASLGMATPDEAGMQSNLNAALLSQLANVNMSAVQQGGGNVGQQQHQGASSTPPADALALLARLSGANNGDGRHQM